MNHKRLLEYEFLEKAKGIIRDQLVNDQFGVEEMAREMGISRASLYRKLKSSTGLSSSEYIRKIKLDIGLDLLENSTANITEIAFECGFKSLSYFHTCFRKQFGITPGEIRKNNHSVLSTDNIGLEEKGSRMFNFPVPASRFIGRKKEMGEIQELLRNSRIVSLVGPGGCGKTRLACEVVKAFENEFQDGLWFVDLAPLESPDLLVKEIMEALQISETSDLDLMGTLKKRINGKDLLIVLDNCEHLAVSCAEVGGILSRSTPGLKILVTSRTILNIEGENVWKVPSLSMQDPAEVKSVEEAMDSDAILLFTNRAWMSDHRFKLSNDNVRDVAAICKILDGMPLALELVANRIRFMDPGLMLQRFSGRFLDMHSSDPTVIDRHKTMKATIEWSYRLLTDEEKLLFTRLCVFSGGFNLEALEKVCTGKPIPREYMLDLLSNLVDRSMVSTIRIEGQPLRYHVLETLKQYAFGLLNSKEYSQLRRKHLDYYTGIAEEACNQRNTSLEFWMNRLRQEHDNMMSALHWAEEHKEMQYQRLSGLLAWYWARSNNYSLARQKLGDLLKNPKITLETRARALTGYAWSMFGQINQASDLIKMAEEVISIWQRLGNKKEEIIARTDLATIYFGFDQDEAGLKLIMECYEEAKILDDMGVLLNCMIFVSQGLLSMRRFDEARAFLVDLLDLADEHGHIFAKSIGHPNYACCDLMEKKFREAEREFGEGVKICEQYGDIHYLYTNLAGVAMAAAGMGRHAKALRLMSGINRAAKRSGNMSPEHNQIAFWQEQMKVHIAGTRDRLGESLTRKYESEGAAMELEEVIRYALEFDED